MKHVLRVAARHLLFIINDIINKILEWLDLRRPPAIKNNKRSAVSTTSFRRSE